MDKSNYDVANKFQQGLLISWETLLSDELALKTRLRLIVEALGTVDMQTLVNLTGKPERDIQSRLGEIQRETKLVRRIGQVEFVPENHPEVDSKRFRCALGIANANKLIRAGHTPALQGKAARARKAQLLSACQFRMSTEEFKVLAPQGIFEDLKFWTIVVPDTLVKINSSGEVLDDECILELQSEICQNLAILWGNSNPKNRVAANPAGYVRTLLRQGQLVAGEFDPRRNRLPTLQQHLEGTQMVNPADGVVKQKSCLLEAPSPQECDPDDLL